MDINSFIIDAINGMKNKDLAQKYDIKVSMVSTLKSRHNIAHAQKVIFSDDQKEKIIELFESGSNLNEIGREFRVVGATIKKLLKDKGYVNFSNKRVQLKELDKAKFINDYNNNYTLEEIQKRYNISDWVLSKAIDEFELERRKYRLQEIATESDLNKIEELARTKQSVATISSELGFSTDMIMNYLDSNNIPRGHGKITYYKGIKMRSSWEVVFAKHLDSLNLYWEYEPTKFNLGYRKYTPDFLVYENGKKVYYEIKGRLSDKDCRRSLLFMEMFPEIDYRMLFEDEINLIKENYRPIEKEVLSYGA